MLLPKNSLFLIGLTGNIACGKSTVVSMLANLGAHTIDADAVTRRLQEPGMPVYTQIVAAFGADVLVGPNGPIDRGKLGAIVFSNPDALQRLEHIVHPAVHAEIEGWLAEKAQTAHISTKDDEPSSVGRAVAVIDAIKLLEAGWGEVCDMIWVVTCAEALQLERLVTNRGMRTQEAQKRIAAQPPQSSRLPYADVVIDTSTSYTHTQQQVLDAWHNRVREHIPLHSCDR